MGFEAKQNSQQVLQNHFQNSEKVGHILFPGWACHAKIGCSRGEIKSAKQVRIIVHTILFPLKPDAVVCNRLDIYCVVCSLLFNLQLLRQKISQ
jgi:hypothetical protein